MLCTVSLVHAELPEKGCFCVRNLTVLLCIALLPFNYFNPFNKRTLDSDFHTQQVAISGNRSLREFQIEPQGDILRQTRFVSTEDKKK